MRRLPLLLLAAALPLAACDGKLVTYTVSIPFRADIHIDESGLFSKTGTFNPQDLDLGDKIPDGADIKRVEITGIGADITIDDATTASSLQFAAVAEEGGEPATRVTLDHNLNLAVAKTFLWLTPDATKQAKLDKLKAKVNAFLKQAGNLNDVRLGVAGAVVGGRLVSDITVQAKLTVTYEVCENIGSELLASEFSECVAGPLD